MFNKIFILISLFLVSCGTFNYPEYNDFSASIAPIISTGILQLMRFSPAAASYGNLINGYYRW